MFLFKNFAYKMDTAKLGKGTSLSEEQYDIVVSYLNTGRKPPLDRLKKANLYGKLNGGTAANSKNCPGYFRFKAIVKRLDIRPTDGALIFKANGKVVLPNNRFRATIMAVHTSRGYKHLHITATLAKLSEKYTIGCRQFGISEEEVRTVIRACRDGSCGDKFENKKGCSVMKNLVRQAYQQENNPSTTSIQSESGPITRQQTASLTGPIVNQIPMIQPIHQSATHEPAYAILEKHPNGHFVMKQIIMKQKGSTLPNIANGSNAQMTNNAADMNSMNNIPILQNFSTTNLPSPYSEPSPVGPIINNVAVMNNMPSLQPIPTFGFITTNFNNCGMNNIQNGTFSTSQFGQLGLGLQKAGVTRFAIPVNFTYSKPAQPPPISNEMLADLIFQLGNKDDNEAASRFKKIDLASFDTETLEYIHQKLEEMTADDSDDEDEFSDSSDQATTKFQNNQTTESKERNQEEGQQPMDEDQEQPQKNAAVPCPFLWYNLKDMEQEKDPYNRIALAIKDMRLDVQKSIRGHNSSMNILKTKLSHLPNGGILQEQSKIPQGC